MALGKDDHDRYETEVGPLCIGSTAENQRAGRGIWTEFAGRRISLATITDDEKLLVLRKLIGAAVADGAVARPDGPDDEF